MSKTASRAEPCPSTSRTASISVGGTAVVGVTTTASRVEVAAAAPVVVAGSKTASRVESARPASTVIAAAPATPIKTASRVESVRTVKTATPAPAAEAAPAASKAPSRAVSTVEAARTASVAVTVPVPVSCMPPTSRKASVVAAELVTNVLEDAVTVSRAEQTGGAASRTASITTVIEAAPAAVSVEVQAQGILAQAAEVVLSTGAAGVQPKKIEKIFKRIDRDQDGRMSEDDMGRILLRLNSRLGRHYGEDELLAFFKKLDVKKEGGLSVEEFSKAFEKVALCKAKETKEAKLETPAPAPKPETPAPAPAQQ